MKFTNAFRKYIIVLTSSLIYFIIFGTVRLNSQLFVAVRERFVAGREQASFPFTLQYSVRNLSGPLIGFIGNKFGLRCTTALGCLLSSVSLAACFLVKDIISFTILWGIAFGIGFGMSAALIPKILHLYFSKSFNFVQGIFLAGGSAGSFVFPGVGEYLLLTYGTSGTFLILSGLVLHSVPLAMLLECPERTPKLESQVEVEEKGEILKMTKDIANSRAENDPKYVYPSNSDVNSEKLYRCEEANNGVIDVSSLPNSNYNENYSGHKNYRLDSTNSVIPLLTNAENGQDVLYKRNELGIKHDIQKQVGSKDSTNLDSIENVNLSVGKSHKYHAKNLPQDSFSFISRNFKVFVDPAYILICISLSFSAIPVAVLHTVMVDAWRDKGISEDVTILMAFAIAGLVGRLGLGYLSDLKCTSPLSIFAMSSGVSGLLLIGFKWLSGFYVTVVYFAVVGVLMGGIIVTRSGVIKDYIGKENLTMAFSSQYFLFGFLALSQPSVIGYFRDTLQSYDGLFYFLGSVCIFGTIIALCVPMAAKYRDKKRNKKKGAVRSTVQNI